MEFKGFSEQTSVLILLGLGFVFFLGFSFYFFTLRNRFPLFLKLILGFLRAFVLVILVTFTVPLYLSSPEMDVKTRQILLVDSSPFIQKEQLDSVKEALTQKYPHLETISLAKSSWRLSLDTLRALDRKLPVDQAFLITDGQMTELDNENNLGFPIQIIGMGPTPKKANAGIYLPLQKIRTVTGEFMYLPIEVWKQNDNSRSKLNLQVWEGSKLVYEKVIRFEGLDAYQRVNVPLQSSKLGTHVLVFKLSNRVQTTLNWQVLKEKALVDGFAKAPHPDLGVISKYALEQYIKIHWHFGEDFQPKSTMKNLIFYQLLPKDLVNYMDRSVWYLGVELPHSLALNASSLHRKDLHFWDLQMDEYRNRKSFGKVDSLFQRLFAQTFLREVQEDSEEKNQKVYPNQDIVVGRNEATLTYLGLKERVYLSNEGQKRVYQKSLIKSIPAWKYPYSWLVLLTLLFVEWGLRKRYI